MIETTTGKIGVGLALAGVGAAGGFGIWAAGSANPETKAGFVGYVTQSPVFGEAHFVELQKGPASPGRHWMYDVVNVSITPYSYNEDFPLDHAPLSKDGLPIQFHLATIWRVNPEKVKQFVEEFTTMSAHDDQGSLELASFNDFMKQPIRSMALDEIHQRGYLDISTDLVKINQSLLERAKKYAENTPFEVMQIAVGNVQFPQAVREAVAQKLAKQQELDRMNTELQITTKRAAQRVEEAKGIAESQEIIAGTLTPQYLAHEAIEAQKLLRDSPNHSVVYIPTNSVGVPVLTSDAQNPFQERSTAESTPASQPAPRVDTKTSK
jgi:regulator of protease activity HflC (stomatin/prohibitin superfamily)